MAKNYDNINDLLHNYSEKHNILEKKNIDYFLEISVIAIIDKNITIMKYVIDYFKNENQIFNSDYMLFYLNIYFLMCSFYYKFTKEKNLEKQYFKLFNFDEIRYSYEDIVSVFLLIYNHSNETKIANRKRIRDEFISLHKTLNYKKFSIDYFDNYFTTK
ncbi:MAG: hypothetical protein ISP71_07500 [Flavobacteriales bacterium]|nr:hypothetical protein [Flavobacteriales bacterium]